MMRLRIAALAAVAGLAFTAIAAPLASAANGTPSQGKGYNFPALYTVKLTGKSAGKQVTASYGIQRYMAATFDGKRQAVAVGTLKATIAGHKFTRYGVMTPATLTGASNSSARAAATCQILHLVLAPIHLSLLGLNLTLGGGTAMNQPIVLDLTANSNGGLLGSLLCGVDNLLNGSGALSSLTSNLNQLVSALEGLTSILSGL